MQHGDIRALTFDVFGTTVDWRGTITREGERLGAAKGIQVDWKAVADRWAQKYVEARNRKGPWLPRPDPAWGRRRGPRGVSDWGTDEGRARELVRLVESTGALAG